jgi:hypothetical protein
LDFDINIVKYRKCRGLFLRERRRRKTRGLTRTEFYTIWFWAALVGSGVFYKTIYPQMYKSIGTLIVVAFSTCLVSTCVKASTGRVLSMEYNLSYISGSLHFCTVRRQILPFCHTVAQTEGVNMVGAPINVSSLKLTTPGCASIITFTELNSHTVFHGISERV